MDTRRGYFGDYGGRFVPEALVSALDQLESAYLAVREDPGFAERLEALSRDYSGRPTPLYHAERLSERCGGAAILLKREDLNHTGAHKINNALGQALLAQAMGKRRIVAETGAGQHGVATAAVCAKFGLQCVVYMGEEDVRRQSLNVFRMKLHGCRGATGRPRQPYAQGRRQRGDPRLGRQRGRYALSHRLRGRPTPLPNASA